ncbi:MAG: hypothetical protein K2J11_03340 [Oscillospiraceae bacterium]|nr:hypothetical protein [Oscillospiraceae bacterium]
MKRFLTFGVVFLMLAVLMSSCGTAVAARGGECRITVTNKGRSIVLPQETAEKLILLAEEILSYEYTGIMELYLSITNDYIKECGRNGLSVIVEYADTHELPVSALDYDIENPDKANIVTYMRSVDSITILIDDDNSYIMANGSVFWFPQEYYDELMSYIQ